MQEAICVQNFHQPGLELPGECHLLGVQEIIQALLNNVQLLVAPLESLKEAREVCYSHHQGLVVYL